jgi:hypothetical protein
MRVFRGPRVDTTILGAASLLALAMGSDAVTEHLELVPPSAVVSDGVVEKDLVGVWLSGDSTVRLSLEADGTYESTVQGRWKAAHGTYRVADGEVRLRDESGLQTTVTRVDGMLEMAGHQLFAV